MNLLVECDMVNIEMSESMVKAVEELSRNHTSPKCGSSIAQVG